MELANLSDFVTSRSNSSTAEVKINDIYKYLRNPEAYIKQIRNTSTYLTNKHGILKDVLRMVKSLPTLKYSLNWSGDIDKKSLSEYEQMAHEFLSDIDVVQVLRNGLYETAELGTVVTCLRSKKYVQFLELDDLVIQRQKNGKWIVEFDLKSLDSIRDMNLKLNKINSLPNEVTLQKYNRYKKSNDDKFRLVELSNCRVIGLDSRRNSPIGFPMTMGAWLSVLQKEMIDRVEQSVSERLITQILMLKAGFLDKDETKPVPREILSGYFKEVTNLLQKKEGRGGRGNNSSGTGTIMLPHYLSLEALKIDTTMFKKELYDKINGDIYANLGVSESMISGRGGNYSSANINEAKFFSIIFTIVEQFQSVINDYLKVVMPKGITCEIKFDDSTVLDREKDIERKRELFMQSNIKTPYFEAVLGIPMNEIVSLRKYEMEQDLDSLFFPAQNAYTSSGKDGGNKPNKTEGEVDNESTMKSKTSDGNSNPSPSNS